MGGLVVVEDVVAVADQDVVVERGPTRYLVDSSVVPGSTSTTAPFAGVALVAGAALYAYKRAKKNKATTNDSGKQVHEGEEGQDLV